MGQLSFGTIVLWNFCHLGLLSFGTIGLGPLSFGTIESRYPVKKMIKNRYFERI